MVVGSWLLVCMFGILAWGGGGWVGQDLAAGNRGFNGASLFRVRKCAVCAPKNRSADVLQCGQYEFHPFNRDLPPVLG